MKFSEAIDIILDIVNKELSERDVSEEEHQALYVFNELRHSAIKIELERMKIKNEDTP